MTSERIKEGPVLRCLDSYIHLSQHIKALWDISKWLSPLVMARQRRFVMEVSLLKVMSSVNSCQPLNVSVSNAIVLFE